MVNRDEGEFLPVGDISIESKDGRRITTKDRNWRPNNYNEDGTIFRYRDIEQYESILRDQYLWFARPDQFDDPFEGSLPRKNIEERIEHYGEREEEIRGLIRFVHRYLIYVSCWYNEDHESEAMWKLHSENGNGLAIKSTPSKLKSAMEASDKAVFGRIKYKDYESYKIDATSPIAPIFHKRNAFKYESEFRVLLQFNGDSRGGTDPTALKDLQPVGIPISTEIEDLVEEVVVSPTASEEYKSDVRSVTEEYGYDFDIVTSELLSSPIF